ncbi:ArpU family phage packaging/lysis transcriptional regulator [Heyndrickxia sporothermodurans]|uniref:ArpU family phage packaging/lysis transcriptional regulator n=1 Tax=Heyndrickxia sporothermodurans TaxID=46224 RepID=UPI002E1EC948|nr:ArpU family phage packaging/lysis transcriptional regulator [Heyndrickxia sporothermodurans]MED3650621.1 ArpU family phage packaging/lysis transcriptional regulator [Heyndrickxia sporothermodurans]MED3697385.1 ArpU family phage packaging/lysis transcriptional regulator [Heyndrickxia sporothermodurans]
MGFELPELDRTATQAAVEAHLETYRLYKYLSFDEREASITSSSEIRYHGPTNETSDQTGNIAIYNVDQQRYRKEFCERTEWAVKKLPTMERFLIEERYMSKDSEYINDMNVYCFKFQPPISHVKYAKIRWKAFYRLALTLNLAITVKN